MVRDEQVFREGCGRRDCIGRFHTLEWRWPGLLRRKLLGNVMMMVVMAKNVSLIGFASQRGQDVLVMMMMRMGFEPLGSTAQRRTSTVAFFIALGIVIFGFSSLRSRSSFTSCFCFTTDLRWRMIQLFSPSQSAVRGW